MYPYYKHLKKKFPTGGFRIEVGRRKTFSLFGPTPHISRVETGFFNDRVAGARGIKRELEEKSRVASGDISMLKFKLKHAENRLKKLDEWISLNV